MDGASDLPHGSAYIGANREFDGTLTFGFSEDVYSIEAFVTALKDEDQRGAVTATAYDDAGNVITASRILGSHVDDWDENLISVHSKTPIAKIVFTGDFLVLDALSFNDKKPDIVMMYESSATTRNTMHNGSIRVFLNRGKAEPATAASR